MKGKDRNIYLFLNEELRSSSEEIKNALLIRLVHRDNVVFNDVNDWCLSRKIKPEDIVLMPSDCRRLLLSDMSFEVGCDEAGRGPLAGPVFAAAVILPDGFYHPLLNDSKQMSEANRDELRNIIETQALSWSVVSVDSEEIDRINILNASITGMHRAISSLTGGIVPKMIYVDGNRFQPYCSIPYQTVVKGDGKLLCIAAASVLAKTHRDEYMRKIAEEYPQYGWDRNMGYPTAEHREAIEKYGPTKYHRMSFKLLAGGTPSTRTYPNRSDEYGFKW